MPFACTAPQIDESPRHEESPVALVARLAEAKARAAEPAHAQHLIIGADQVATHRNAIIGKPGNHQAAQAQLTNFSGQAIRFFTGVAVYNSGTKTMTSSVVNTTVFFRHLTIEEIDNYLQRERPYNCAGSFKAEALGIALFDKIVGDDPTAIIGLPLIELRRLLATMGFDLLNKIH